MPLAPLLSSLLPAVICGLPCLAPCDSVALAQADTLFAHRNYKAAANAYRKLVDKGSCMAHAYCGLAGCAQLRNEPDAKMVELMNPAVAAAPTDAMVLRTRLKAYQSLKMHDRSLADLEAAMPYLPNDSVRVDFLTGQTFDLMNMRRFEEAQQKLERA